jgi:adenosylcobinamide-phosphate synthase
MVTQRADTRAVRVTIGPALVALAVDLLAGEPPTRMHPTVAMGRWIARGRAARRSRAPLPSLLEGVAVVAGGAFCAAALGLAADRVIGAQSRKPRVLLRGLALKPTMSVRALLSAATEVEDALNANDLNRARARLSWHLVSRDTSGLSSSEVAAAAIESLAENLNDALVAPLMAFRSGGLAAAYLFRFVNTADSMLGYHTPELEWFGKAAARADDALAFLPARVATCLIACGAGLTGASARGALRVAITDARNTASPNAGWPMAAMAGALGIRLAKRDHYILNNSARLPRAHDVRRARHIVLAASLLAAITADVA